MLVSNCNSHSHMQRLIVWWNFYLCDHPILSFSLNYFVSNCTKLWIWCKDKINRAKIKAFSISFIKQLMLFSELNPWTLNGISQAEFFVNCRLSSALVLFRPLSSQISIDRKPSVFTDSCRTKNRPSILVSVNTVDRRL